MEAEASVERGRGLHHSELSLPRRAARDVVLRMTSKYACFDRSRLIVKPLAERSNDLEIGRWLALDDAAPEYSHPQLSEPARRIIVATKSGASRILMMATHVGRAGVNRHIFDLLERGGLIKMS